MPSADASSSAASPRRIASPFGRDTRVDRDGLRLELKER